MVNSPLTLLRHHRHWLLALALAWMLLIYMLSALSSIHIPDLFPQQDKALHSLLFGILGFLWALLIMSDGSRPTFWHVLIVILLVIGYAGIDEFHQSLVPGRTPDILDLAADASGGLIGALLVMVLVRRYGGQ